MKEIILNSQTRQRNFQRARCLERKKIGIEQVCLRMTRLRLRRGYLTRKREDRLYHLKRRGRRSWCRGERLVRRRFPVGSFGKSWFYLRLDLRSCRSRIEDDLCRVLPRFLRQEEVAEVVAAQERIVRQVRSCLRGSICYQSKKPRQVVLRCIGRFPRRNSLCPCIRNVRCSFVRLLFC